MAAVVLVVSLASAQSLPSGVEDVVKLKQAGLPEDIILSQIRNSQATYSLTADQIIYLKSQGISDTVIKALISGNGSPTAPTAPATTPAAPRPAPAPPPSAVAPSETAAAPPPAAPGVSFGSFQAELSPHGNWIRVPGYGSCWQPAVSVRDLLWRPYFDQGHWSYTDAGWSWQSDYSWGDTVFHYGRWLRYNDVWSWVPGYDWAPAWVSWREADGYCGWAPLPPGAVFKAGLGLYYDGHLALDVDFGLGVNDFTFVGYDHFWDHDMRAFFVPHDRAIRFFRDSRIVNGYHLDHGRFVIEGLGHDHIFAVTHHDARIEHDTHGWNDPRGDRDRHDRGW